MEEVAWHFKFFPQHEQYEIAFKQPNSKKLNEKLIAQIIEIQHFLDKVEQIPCVLLAQSDIVASACPR